MVGKKDTWQFPRSSDEKLLDKEQSYWGLKFGDIKRGTESTAVAAQDQALSTNCFKKRILKEETGTNVDFVKNTKKLMTT
jgi:hypothetical protein